jgi:hypothetical protein
MNSGVTTPEAAIAATETPPLRKVFVCPITARTESRLLSQSQARARCAATAVWSAASRYGGMCASQRAKKNGLFVSEADRLKVVTKPHWGVVTLRPNHAEPGGFENPHRFQRIPSCFCDGDVRHRRSYVVSHRTSYANSPFFPVGEKATFSAANLSPVVSAGYGPCYISTRRPFI